VPESSFSGLPEELPLPPPLLELLVPLPDVLELELELLPEPDAEPRSGELPVLLGVEEQAVPAAAAATPREKRTAPLEYFSVRSFSLAVMETGLARLLPQGSRATTVDRRGELLFTVEDDCAPTVSGYANLGCTRQCAKQE
jgi:hypothetical protein